MKTLLLFVSLFSLNLYAGEDCVDCGNKLTGVQVAMVGGGMNKLSQAVASESLIEDDNGICGPVERNSFKDLVANLKKRYNTTLEESYFKIKCDGKDILGMVIENPADRYFVGMNLERYFKKKIGKPEIFSRILVNQIHSRDILSRINFMLQDIKGNESLEEAYNKKLLKMRDKYKAYLKEYPIKV